MQQSTPLVRAAAAYGRAEHQSPARQVALLCARAIRYLGEARAATEERRIEARFAAVTQAHTIGGGLRACLDFTHGGEIAPLLDRLYAYLLGRLTQINLRDDPAICDEAIGLLTRMRDGWAEIASRCPDRAPGTGQADLPPLLSA